MPMMIDLASPSAAPSPDWVAHAFPASVRGNPNYIDLCLDTLESLVFQDCVLPELRPKPLDPVGESRYRLGVFFTNCLSEYADPGNPRQFVDVLPAAGADDDAKKLFFRTTEAALFNSIANAANVPTLRAEMAIHFPVLLGRERSFGALKLPVATKTRPMDAAYREQVNSGSAVDESAFQAQCTVSPEIREGLFAAYAAIVVANQPSKVSQIALFWAPGPHRDYMTSFILPCAMRARDQLHDDVLWALSHLLEMRRQTVLGELAVVMPSVPDQRRRDWVRFGFRPVINLPADPNVPGSAAQPDFFAVNFRDLLPTQSQDEPAVYELGNVAGLSYFTNFLALIESGAPEVGCKAERDAFKTTMSNVFASGRHSKMDARLITLLLATEWVQLDVLAVIKQLTINRARPTAGATMTSSFSPASAVSVPHFAPQVSTTTPSTLRAVGMSRPDPSWRHIERRKTMCLNAIDTFNVDADHSGQINHMMPSGLSSSCEWDSRYSRGVGSAKSGAKLLSSTHRGWAEHAHTVSSCMQSGTILPVFYYFEDNRPGPIMTTGPPQQQPLAKATTAEPDQPTSKRAQKRTRNEQQAKLVSKKAAAEPPSSSPSLAIVPARAPTAPPNGAAAPIELMEIEDRLSPPFFPSPSPAARGAFEKVLREDWKCYTDFSSARKKPDLPLKILNMTNGATETDLVDYLPEGGWNKGLDGLTRLCFKDLLSLLSRGVVGPDTIYKQRRQMDAKDKPTEVTIGCGSLRKDRNLGPERCSCQCGAHWLFTACAGKWGGQPVPPAKDTVKVSAGQWLQAFNCVREHFEIVLPTAENAATAYNTTRPTASSFDSLATVV